MMEATTTTALTTTQNQATPEPQLGVLHAELTQNAIDMALQEFNTSYTIEKYVEQQRGAFYVKIGGPVTLSNFGLTIAHGKGIPSVDITNEFRLFCRIPILGEKQFESLPFHISSPKMGVSLHADGSKGYASLHLYSLKIELLQGKMPSSLTNGRLGSVLDLVKQSIKLVVEEVTRAINEKLQREPFQLFDLSNTDIPLGDTKKLSTRIVLDELAFKEDRIAARLQIFSRDP